MEILAVVEVESIEEGSLLEEGEEVPLLLVEEEPLV